MALHIRPAQPTDAAAILQINAQNVARLSPMDAPRLQGLAAMAAQLLVLDDASETRIQGFCLGLTDGQNYDSSHYRWFAARLKHFLYIDRIALSVNCRGQGWGRRIYERLAREAQAAGLLWLAAEVDSQPRNEASLAFHQTLGFREVGERLGDSGKRVSLQLKSLP